MHVAAHLGSRVWGGAERAVTNLLRGLQARGHRVLLYCNDEVVAREAAELGVPTAIEPLGGDVAIHHALRFARAMRRDRPDVLVLGTFKKMWLAAIAARLAGVPRFVARIGLETDTPRSVKYRWVLPRWVDAIVLTSDTSRAQYERVLPGAKRPRVVTILTGVVMRAPTRTRAEMRSELGLPASAPVIGAVGRLARQKRFDRLLDAMTLLPPDVHCVLAGDGPLRAELEARVASLGLGDRVHLLGHREDVGNVLVTLDLFVLSSDREGLANAMLEALALGVPVVSTAVSGAAEALAPFADGARPGAIVERSPEALAVAIAPILDDASMLTAMRAAAARRARERFDFEGMITEWERVLRP